MLDVRELLGKVRPQISGNPQPGFVVPHVYSFNALINSASRIYSYRYDEALRHMQSNALAMRRDAFIESLLQERYFPTSQRNWSVKVPDPNNAYQAYVAKCITNGLRAIPRFNSLRYNLLEAVWYGRYGSQINWHQRLLNGKRYWTVGDHMPVNGDKIQYGWDNVPSVAINPQIKSAYPEGLTSYSDRGVALLRLERPEHRRQFIIHRHIITDADYFEAEMGGGINGIGIRSKIYWAWWLRDEMLSWATDFMQKVGTLGLLIFMYEDGNAHAKADAEDAAQKASTEVALTMAIPPGQNTKPTNAVQHVAPNDGGINALRGMIEDYFERHIERMIVGQPSSGDSSGNGFGGSAGMALHADTKYQLLKFDANNLDETLTQDLIRVMVELNHSDVDFPVQFVSSVSNPEDAAKLQAVQTASEIGVTFRADEVRDLTGMGKPDMGDETVGGEKPAESDPFGGAGDKPFPDKGDESEPGQGLTTNAKVERENGSGQNFAPLKAYADDGSVFADYVDLGHEHVVTLALNSDRGDGVSVHLSPLESIMQVANKLLSHGHQWRITEAEAVQLATDFVRGRRGPGSNRAA